MFLYISFYELKNQNLAQNLKVLTFDFTENFIFLAVKLIFRIDYT
jgi:hypothetical protein